MANETPWVSDLRSDPAGAVAGLLSGAASIYPFEGLSPADAMLAIMPRSARIIQRKLLGEPSPQTTEDADTGLVVCLDEGLAQWFDAQWHIPHRRPRSKSPMQDAFMRR